MGGLWPGSGRNGSYSFQRGATRLIGSFNWFTQTSGCTNPKITVFTLTVRVDMQFIYKKGGLLFLFIFLKHQSFILHVPADLTIKLIIYITIFSSNATLTMMVSSEFLWTLNIDQSLNNGPNSKAHLRRCAILFSRKKPTTINKKMNEHSESISSPKSHYVRNGEIKLSYTTCFKSYFFKVRKINRKNVTEWK